MSKPNAASSSPETTPRAGEKRDDASAAIDDDADRARRDPGGVDRIAEAHEADQQNT